MRLNPDGSIEVESLDGYCKLLLDPNRFIFSVSYLQLVPQKKPAWVKNSDIAEENENNAILSN